MNEGLFVAENVSSEENNNAAVDEVPSCRKSFRFKISRFMKINELNIDNEALRIS